jgi:hypothetical protein
MKKYFCDICKREVQWSDVHKLSIESEIYITPFSYNTGQKTRTVDQKELCPHHAKKIEDFIQGLTYEHEGFASDVKEDRGVETQ